MRFGQAAEQRAVGPRGGGERRSWTQQRIGQRPPDRDRLPGTVLIRLRATNEQAQARPGTGVRAGNLVAGRGARAGLPQPQRCCCSALAPPCAAATSARSRTGTAGMACRRGRVPRLRTPAACKPRLAPWRRSRNGRAPSLRRGGTWSMVGRPAVSTGTSLTPWIAAVGSASTIRADAAHPRVGGNARPV